MANWNKLQDGLTAKAVKEHKKPVDTKMQDLLRTFEGKQFSISGKCKGIDRFGKLALESFEACPELEDILTMHPNVKCPYKKMFGFGGQIYFVTISLGFSKHDQALISKLNSMVGAEVTYGVTVQSYSSPKFGSGLTLILTNIQ